MVPLCASNPPPTCSSPFHRFTPAGRGGAGYTVPGGRLTYSMMACFGSCVVMVELSFGSSHPCLVLPTYIVITFSHILPYGLTSTFVPLVLRCAIAMNSHFVLFCALGS